MRFQAFLSGVLLGIISAANGYEIGCIYPPAMPDPITAQDIMVNFNSLNQQDISVETPIAVHNGFVSAMCGVSCLAMHDSKAKNPWGERPLLVAPEFGHNAFSIALCSLSCHTVAIGYQTMKPLLDRWQANITEGLHPGLMFLHELEEEPSMSDLLRAVQVIKEHDYHPFLIGQVAVGEIYQYFLLQDGWNSFGNYSYDMLTQSVVNCTSNCMPFSDLSGYYPRNHPGRPYTEAEKYNVTGDDMYWQPLLEDDGYGYFSRQQHVVPHLATTAVPYLDPYIRNKTLDPPSYDYYEEALKVVEELRLTAESQQRRAKIEVFDNKFDVRGIFQYATRNQFATQHSYQRHLVYLYGISMAEDEGALLSWTEKIRHDLVRPTTVIQRWASDKLLTYGGDPNSFEAKEIEARNFEAFIRVMPHSEFPSGSACLCTTYREFADLFTMHYYGAKIDSSFLKYGVDGHETNCNGTVFPDLAQGWCSDTHKFTLRDMTELEEVCGQSRLWGGMHFTKSVPAGHELCEGIGTMAMERLKDVFADTDFGGNEWFVGDAMPLQCSDPLFQVNGNPVSVQRSSSTTVQATSVAAPTKALGFLGAVALVGLLLNH